MEKVSFNKGFCTELHNSDLPINGGLVSADIYSTSKEPTLASLSSEVAMLRAEVRGLLEDFALLRINDANIGLCV
jgi:hypothetical protein